MLLGGENLCQSVGLLHDADIVSGELYCNGCCESAKAGADNNDVQNKLWCHCWFYFDGSIRRLY